MNYANAFSDEFRSGIEFETSAGDVDADTMFGEFDSRDMGFEVTSNREDFQIAREVEHAFISLLREGELSEIQMLSGEIPANRVSVNSDVAESFSADYARAVSYNPALKWYARLSKIFGNEFKVKDGRLVLRISKKMWNNMVAPHLGDFVSLHLEESPIVSLISNLRNRIEGQQIETTKEMISEQALSDNRPAINDLNVAELDDGLIEDGDLEFMQGSEERAVTLQDPNELGLDGLDFTDSSEEKAERNIPLNLRELSYKGLADHLIAQGITHDGDVVEALLENGFSKREANEIAVLVRYTNANVFQAKKTANQGDTSFPFEV